MPDKIGSISAQWGKIGGKKTSETPDSRETSTPEPPATEQVEPQIPTPSDDQSTKQQRYSDTSTPGVQTSGIPNNKLTSPQNNQEFELPDYQWTNELNDQDTEEVDDLPLSELEGRTTRNLGTRATKGHASQTSNRLSKKGTKLKVVQYTREVRPERKRQTVYLYPEVVRWIKRRIADTDEEISDVGNYTAELCMWLEEKHPEIISKFERQRRK